MTAAASSARVVYSAAAGEDARTAALWLEGVWPGFGSAFLTELGRVAENIRGYPDLYQCFRGDCRRAVLRRFDYAVVCRVLPGFIQVVSVPHCRLDPAVFAVRPEPLMPQWTAE